MRIIDADEALRLSREDELAWVYDLTDLEEFLVGVPTIDAVPVVRCKDCKWCSQSGLCNLYISFTPSMKPDDFCSYGERRSDDGTA